MSCDGCPYNDKFNDRCTLSDEEWTFLADNIAKGLEDGDIYPCFAQKAVTE